MTCAQVVRPHAFRRTELPTVEPLSLAEAQRFLRLPIAAEDPETEQLLAAARDAVEGRLERALLEQTWECRLDGFWGSADLELPMPNLLTVESIEYLADTSDTWTTVDDDLYEVDVVSVPGRVRLRADQAWPTPYARPGCVRVTWTAGYGTTAAAVPPKLVQAVRLLLAHYDRNREAVVTGTISNELPEGVAGLLALEDVPWTGD